MKSKMVVLAATSMVIILANVYHFQKETSQLQFDTQKGTIEKEYPMRCFCLARIVMGENAN